MDPKRFQRYIAQPRMDELAKVIYYFSQTTITDALVSYNQALFGTTYTESLSEDPGAHTTPLHFRNYH